MRTRFLIVGIGFLAAACGDDGLGDLRSEVAPTQAQEQRAFDLGRECIEARYRISTQGAVLPASSYPVAVSCPNAAARACCSPECAADGFSGQACVRKDQSISIALASDPFCEPMASKLKATEAASVAFQSGVPRDQAFDIYLTCGGES